MNAHFFPRPLFEDGKAVEFGNEFTNSIGEVDIVRSISFEPNFYSINGDNGCSTYEIGERVERARDTWERLERDATKECCEYFGYHLNCKDCPAWRGEFESIAEEYGCAAEVSMMNDIIRRAKALAGVE